MRTKLVKVHRDMTESEIEQSKARMQEVIDMCGGRLELVHVVNTTLAKLGFTEEVLTGQEVSNCLHRSRTSPQIAIRIERALQSKGDDYKRFTRYYFCPDMTDPQFDRVEASMFQAKAKRDLFLSKIKVAPEGYDFYYLNSNMDICFYSSSLKSAYNPETTTYSKPSSTAYLKGLKCIAEELGCC